MPDFFLPDLICRERSGDNLARIVPFSSLRGLIREKSPAHLMEVSRAFMNECRHRPPCGEAATRWVCGQRTNLESAVNRGLINRDGARELLRKYKVPMTPESKVYKGAPSVPVRKDQGGLW